MKLFGVFQEEGSLFHHAFNLKQLLNQCMIHTRVGGFTQYSCPENLVNLLLKSNS